MLKRLKPIIYLSIALGLLLYAVPQLEIGSGLTAANIFAIVWLGIVLLIIAAHLHTWLGVDEETKQEMQRVKQYKRYRTQAWIESKARRVMGAKE